MGRVKVGMGLDEVTRLLGKPIGQTTMYDTVKETYGKVEFQGEALETARNTVYAIYRAPEGEYKLEALHGKIVKIHQEP